MTQEEKAKLYDEAIRNLRGMVPNWERLSYNGKTFLQDLIYIFPELAESEDEKIKKEITELVMQPTWKTEKEFHRRKELCDWLKKQGEQKETLCDKCRKEQPSHSCQDITELGRCALEKQGEQKPAWSEKDDSHLIHCVRLINNAEGCSISEQENAIVWLKSIKQRIGG